MSKSYIILDYYKGTKVKRPTTIYSPIEFSEAEAYSIIHNTSKKTISFKHRIINIGKYIIPLLVSMSIFIASFYSIFINIDFFNTLNNNIGSMISIIIAIMTIISWFLVRDWYEIIFKL